MVARAQAAEQVAFIALQSWIARGPALRVTLDIGNTPVTTHIAGSQFDLL
jgi:hypothetical protein